MSDDEADRSRQVGPRKRARVGDEPASFGEVKIDPLQFKDTPGDAFVAEDHGGDGFDETSGAASAATATADGAAGDKEKRARGPNHNARMHPRNEYRDKRPDFAALGAAVPSFGALYVW